MEGTAVVKAVTSGDTVILQGRANNGPPPERQLSLSSLLAPKVARGPNGPEEPYGWAAREHLRKLLVGFPVKFKIDYKVPTLNNREFGTLWLNGSAESVNKTVAKEGWAYVRKPMQGREGEQSPELEELLAAEAEAQAAKRGMYGGAEGGSGSTRDVKWGDVDSEELLRRVKGKPTKMIIEYVRDGASFRAIVVEGAQHSYINLSLAGVQAPRVNTQPKAASAAGTEGAAAAPAAAPKPEPHALESRFFTETRLLQREVDVLVGGIDKYGTFYGNILHPKGNISLELLKNGLARVVDYSIDFAGRDNALQYRLAERTAKAAQLRMWKGYTPATITGTKEFAATVIEILSGDTVVVKPESADSSSSNSGVGEERKLSLSSLRAPRQGNRARGQPDEPWAAEAKEHLRSKLIGRSVTVVVDYEREIPLGGTERKEKRAYASLYAGKGAKKKSVGEALVAEGLATVLRHRQDEDRAENYDDLLVAETAAKAAKKGVHAGGEGAPPPPRVTDLSLDAKKARSYLPHLQRESDVRAVVEYVFSGSRFKLFIPSENCSVMMALSALRTPNPPRAAAPGEKSGRSGDPFGAEAKAVTRQHLLQRTVEVSLQDMDKNGVALGHIAVVGGSGERHPYGLELVKRGLARVDERGTTALAPAFAHALTTAQAEAQAANRGIWSIEEAGPAAAEEEVTAAGDEVLDVKVSEIVDGARCFLHLSSGKGKGAEQLKDVDAKMKALTTAEGLAGKLAFEPRRGNVVAAVFDDGENGPLWYRARVEEKLPNNGGFKVLFIDYGNRAAVPASKVRTLDGALSAIPPQAKEAALAFLRAPAVGDDYGQEAGQALAALTWGKPLKARVLAREGATLVVSLSNPESAGGKKTVNQEMVEQGLARVSKRADRLAGKLAPAAGELVAELKEAQEGARRGRLGMWRYGDVADSDDEYGF